MSEENKMSATHGRFFVGGGGWGMSEKSSFLARIAGCPDGGGSGHSRRWQKIIEEKSSNKLRQEKVR